MIALVVGNTLVTQIICVNYLLPLSMSITYDLSYQYVAIIKVNEDFRDTL